MFHTHTDIFMTLFISLFFIKLNIRNKNDYLLHKYFEIVAYVLQISLIFSNPITWLAINCLYILYMLYTTGYVELKALLIKDNVNC